MINNLIENLIPLYAEYFFKNEKDLVVRYSIVRMYVCYWVLNTLYERFLNNKEIKKIEELSDINKNKYWGIACALKEVKEERIFCSKAAYTLDIITNKYVD